MTWQESLYLSREIRDPDLDMQPVQASKLCSQSIKTRRNNQSCNLCHWSCSIRTQGTYCQRERKNDVHETISAKQLDWTHLVLTNCYLVRTRTACMVLYRYICMNSALAIGDPER